MISGILIVLLVILSIGLYITSNYQASTGNAEIMIPTQDGFYTPDDDKSFLHYVQTAINNSIQQVGYSIPSIGRIFPTPAPSYKTVIL